MSKKSQEKPQEKPLEQNFRVSLRESTDKPETPTAPPAALFLLDEEELFPMSAIESENEMEEENGLARIFLSFQLLQPSQRDAEHFDTTLDFPTLAVDIHVAVTIMFHPIQRY